MKKFIRVEEIKLHINEQEDLLQEKIIKIL
jgi:hypothetical protein